MGTFAEVFADKGAIVPESKREEFSDRIEKLYQNGGMMEVKYIKLYEKEIPTIHKARMGKKGMNFYYNYFEDDCWENAGFDKEDGDVWSNKIGWSHFHRAVVAAYVLQELYVEGVSATMVDGVPVTSWGYVGWINYLFDEKFHVKNFDPWKLFETVHYLGDTIESPKEASDAWFDFGKERYAFIGGCEIYAVLYGTDAAIKRFETEEIKKPERLALESMKTSMLVLRQYMKESRRDAKEQLKMLMQTICTYYETTDCHSKGMGECDEKYSSVLTTLTISDAPAFIVKAISEIYDKDFWDLWTQIKDVVRRKRTDLYGNEGYNVVPIPTVKFFRQSPDDMIPYWEENCDFEFSKELWKWFKDLKNQFDIIVQSGYVIKNPMEYMLSLMEYADEMYYRIYTFTDFWEECIENLYDKRYLTLWKIYEQMLYDPDLKAAGDVLFVTDELGPENEGVHDWEIQPKRRLKRYWDVIDLKERNNKARVTFRRYMALVANKALRYKVFGF